MTIYMCMYKSIKILILILILSEISQATTSLSVKERFSIMRQTTEKVEVPRDKNTDKDGNRS